MGYPSADVDCRRGPYPDAVIAGILNRQGRTTAYGHRFEAFRLALTAFLDLRSPELSDASDDQDYNHIAGGMPFSGPQAILMADEAPDQTPPAG